MTPGIIVVEKRMEEFKFHTFGVILAAALSIESVGQALPPAQTAVLLAQDGAARPDQRQTDQPSDQTSNRMAQAIRKEILTLPNYGVFDWLTFSLNNYNVVLQGYASRPTLKSSAEQVTKKVEGVAAVENRIEVLPLGRADDQIRAQAYVRIYGNTQLSRYNPNRGTPILLSPARIAAGLTQDPPVGNHPIHIVVQNGNITLYGTVLNDGDKSIAGMMANQVPGAFSVKNELTVEMAQQKEKD
jgi:hyperosmotically inducible protein